MTEGRLVVAAPIATARLDLEPLAGSHADEMAGVLADPALYTFTGGTPPTRAALRERYAALADGVSPDRREAWLNWVLRRRADGVAVGYVQATVPVEPDSASGTSTATVSWVVATSAQGRGYATEAAGALVTWLLGRGVDRVRADVHPDHVTSQRVALTAGLHPTGDTVDGETVWLTDDNSG